MPISRVPISKMPLKCLLLNVQDLFIFLDKAQEADLELLDEKKWQLLGSGFTPNKPLGKVFALAQAITDSKADIVLLTEVGGEESLNNFNRHFLNERFQPMTMPSRSDRGIDTAYLVNKDLLDQGMSFDLRDHTHSPMEDGRHFARGLLELCIQKDNQHRISLLLAHFKSKLDLKKKDFEGREQRRAEARFIANYHQKFRKVHPNTAFMLCGDLNGIIYKDETEPELAPLTESGLIDVLELQDRELAQRFTYYFFKPNSCRYGMQLDYALIDKQYAHKIVPNARVLNPWEESAPNPPLSLAQKQKLPTDHYPLYWEISL